MPGRGRGEGPPLDRSVFYGGLEDSEVEFVVGVAFVSVDEGVVVAAEETEVDQGGFASVCPGENVVDVELPPFR